MTSEIALLNRSAVALAADSAMTVRYWDEAAHKFQTRFFKGTNKIFQLSAVHPVGIMVYASATLQGVPWDVLIKSYRDQLGSKSHGELPTYATDFFKYIAGNTHIFSAERQEKRFKSDVITAASRIFFRILGRDDYKAAVSDDEKRTVIAGSLANTARALHEEKFIGATAQDDTDEALHLFGAEIKTELENHPIFQDAAHLVDLAELAKLAIAAIFKVHHTPLDDSGIVIAGFGEIDFFPRLVAYRCYGLILGKLVWMEEIEKQQDLSQSDAAIVPFAQDEMIRTFIFGLGGDSINNLERRFVDAIDDFCSQLTKFSLLADASKNDELRQKLDAEKAKVKEAYGNAILEHFTRSHMAPLFRVLGMLPLDELAELAETLISIESLKERVTRPSESVGGPIDVAVVSKNDGFIWMKRKHYFDPKINPRFFVRKGIQPHA